jgi:arylsulfatase A-like enzyme
MNILPAYLGTNDEKPVRQAAVHTSSRGLFAIRKGKWKLFTHQGSGQNSKSLQDPDKPPMQLYDMSKDFSELNNLYNEHPEKVKELLGLLEKYKSQGQSQPSGLCDFL